MTTPTGHPDFQDIVQWRGGSIIAQNFSVTTLAPLIKDSLLQNFASLQIAVNVAAGNGVILTIDYYTDSTKTVHIDSDSWQLWACQMSAVAPILGPYAEFTLSTRNAGTMTGFIYVAPTNVAVPKTSYPTGGNLAQSQSESVAANTTNSHLLPFLAVGEMWLQSRPSDTSGKLQLQVHEIDDTGAVQGTVAENDSFTLPISLQGAAKERVLRLDIFNTDAVSAHTLSYRMTILSQ